MNVSRHMAATVFSGQKMLFQFEIPNGRAKSFIIDHRNNQSRDNNQIAILISIPNANRFMHLHRMSRVLQKPYENRQLSTVS